MMVISVHLHLDVHFYLKFTKMIQFYIIPTFIDCFTHLYLI